MRWWLELRLALDSIVVHKGHENLLGILLIGEDIGLNKFNALVVKSDFDLEVVAEIL